VDEAANLATIYLFNSDQEFNMKLWEKRLNSIGQQFH